MMDGISAMDTGNNGQMLQMNIESIAEVKVLTQGYQAEYGRSSGLQITAVTKSGTNRFRGSGYSLFTNSDWNTTPWVTADERRSQAAATSKTLGYSIGGPVGKPGGTNKLFFFYATSTGRRTTRSTTATRFVFACRPRLERAGDFSQTLDNNGALFNFIKDPASPALQRDRPTACFRDGGVLGKIPANRLYSTGIDILNRYPAPNLTQTAGQLQLRARRDRHAAPDRDELSSSRRSASTTRCHRSCASPGPTAATGSAC